MAGIKMVICRSYTKQFNQILFCNIFVPITDFTEVSTIEPSFEFKEFFSRRMGCVTLKLFWFGLCSSRWSGFSLSLLLQPSKSKQLGEITFSKECLRSSFSFAAFLDTVNGWSSSKTWVCCALLSLGGL